MYFTDGPSSRASLAIQRFGLGALPGEIATARVDPVGFLLAQLVDSKAALIVTPLPTSAETARGFLRANRELATQRKLLASERIPAPMSPIPMEDKAGAAPKSEGIEKARAEIRRVFVEPELDARFTQVCTTQTAFLERLVQFWINHFAVSVDKGQFAAAANPGFEREAIRPNVTGRFVDLLVAVTRHPAMLFYLDNQKSMGSNSRSGLKSKKSLNENLAREIIELHSLGVNGGYSQADVTNFANTLTGWTIVPFTKPDGGTFFFNAAAHEPGPKTILNRTYTQTGEDQARTVLVDLARHPSTAQHIARKLAIHFVADKPPEALVKRLSDAFINSDGDLLAVYTALVKSPESWTPVLGKIRRPFELVIAASRALNWVPPTSNITAWSRALGQPPMSPPSPKGWPDEAAPWLAPDAIKQRLDWANLIGARMGAKVDAVAVAESALGALLTDETRTAIRRAESRSQALTLFLMSPEFQRR